MSSRISQNRTLGILETLRLLETQCPSFHPTNCVKQAGWLVGRSMSPFSQK